MKLKLLPPGTSSLTKQQGRPTNTNTHTHTSCTPRLYPYVMRVNKEDYSYHFSPKWCLAGILGLISVCESICPNWRPVSVTAALPANASRSKKHSLEWTLPVEKVRQNWGGQMQYNGRLCYTDNNGCGLHTDTLMSVGNVGNVSFPVEEDTLQR